jgi:hypothetical protein
MKLQHILPGVLMILLVLTPVKAERVRFAVIGDSQGAEANATDEAALSKIVGDVLAADPPVQFVVVVGDLVSGVADPGAQLDAFKTWRQITAPWYQSNFFGLKVYVLPGNHDEVNALNYSRTWQEAFPELPTNGPEDDQQMTYSFDAGPCHLVAVNTSAPNLLRAHTVNINWLRTDLAKSNQPIKLVFGHEPAYKPEINVVASLDCQGPLRDEFWQLLSQDGVKAYFCGHIHGYDHWIKDNVHQIIAACRLGYYLIVEADETDVTVSKYDEPDNTLAETYKLSDTANVPHEDRTKNDAPYWPYNSAPCNWATGALMVILFFGFSWLAPKSLFRIRHRG